LQKGSYVAAIALTKIATQPCNSLAKDAAINVLVRGLQHLNSYVRSIVVDKLAIIGSDHAVNPLLIILKDQDWSMRNEAAKALGKIGDLRAINGLIIASEDPDESVRSSAITALGNLKATVALELLAFKLQDPFSFVRLATVRALGKLGCDRAVEPLILELQDPDPIVRWTIAEALGNLGNEQAIEPLIQALQDMHSMVQEAAILALGKIGSDRALEPLTAILTNSNSSLRRAAVISLQKIGGKLPIQTLLGDNDSHVQKLAVQELLKTTVLKQPAEALINELQNPFSVVRAESAKLLGEMSADSLAIIGIERVVNAIADLLNDISSMVKKTALIALGRINSDLAINPLVSLLQNVNEHRHLRRDAVFLLEKIGTERVFHPITLALKDPIPCVRIAAVSSVCHIGGEWAIDTLLNALRDPYWQGRKSAKYVYNALVKIGGVRVEEEFLNALHNPNTSRFVRRTIIFLLPEIGTKKSSDTLISLIANSRGCIKVMAINKSYQIIEYTSNHDYISSIINLLIAALGDAQAQVRIRVIYQIKLLLSRPQYADYLEPVISALTIAVSDKNKDVCREAITTLVKIYSPIVFNFLIQTLTHSEPWLVKQAIENLGKMIYIQTVLKLPIITLTDAQINLAIAGLKTASTNSELLVSKTAKEILAQLQI